MDWSARGVSVRSLSVNAKPASNLTALFVYAIHLFRHVHVGKTCQGQSEW